MHLYAMFGLEPTYIYIYICSRSFGHNLDARTFKRFANVVFFFFHLYTNVYLIKLFK